MRWSLPAALLLSLWAMPASGQECIDPTTPDCDDDGYPAQDDCNDRDPDVNPGMEEVCNNDIDDDCNEIIDEDCFARFQDGRLEGGSTCEGTGSGWATLLFFPVFWGRRRS